MLKGKELCTCPMALSLASHKLELNGIQVLRSCGLIVSFWCGVRADVLMRLLNVRNLIV